MAKPKTIRRGVTISPVEFYAIISLVVISVYLLAPRAASALENLVPRQPSGAELTLGIQAMQNKTVPYGTFPVAEEGSPNRIMKVPVTAYSSEVGQTDSTPFTTASGTTVRDGVVAANFLPIGTHVKFPDLYGEKVFVVEDRMNARYWKHMDIWMPETSEAKNFGLQWTTIEVF